MWMIAAGGTGIKWERRPIFIVDDDTTDQRIFMNFEKMKRWKKTKYKVPTMRVFKDNDEVAQMIARPCCGEVEWAKHQ